MGDGELLTAAMEYAARGLSVIACIGKKPAVPAWKPFQLKRPNEHELRGMFAPRGVTGLAVILGEVSGWLYARDFDQAESYNAWAKAHADLTAKLPTSRTARGYHVFGRHVADLGVKDLGDGELRREGGYVLLPPSLHPNGTVYRWVHPLNGTIPTLDPAEAGLDRSWSEQSRSISTGASPPTSKGASPLTPSCHTEHTPTPPEKLSALSNCVPACSVWQEEDVRRLVELVAPTAIEANHRSLFALARGVLDFEKRAGRKATAGELRLIFDLWAKAAAPFLNPQNTLEDYRVEFAEARARATFGLESGPMLAEIAEAAAKREEPAARSYENPGVRLLVNLCAELQARAGDAPFFLDFRTAQRIVHPEGEPRTVQRWMRLLILDGLVEQVSRGTLREHKASTYRYGLDRDPSQAV